MLRNSIFDEKKERIVGAHPQCMYTDKYEVNDWYALKINLLSVDSKDFVRKYFGKKECFASKSIDRQNKAIWNL